MISKLVTGPEVEPVTLAEAKVQCRVDTDDENTYITSLIKVARRYAEQYQGRCFLRQTWRAVMDCFPVSTEYAKHIGDRQIYQNLSVDVYGAGGVIELPKSPLIDVTSITYTDPEGNVQTVDPSIYRVDTDSYLGRLLLNWNCSWPATRMQHNCVAITYRAGFGTTAADVPDEIKQAILLSVGHWFENREPGGTYNTANGQEIMMGVHALLGLGRVVNV